MLDAARSDAGGPRSPFVAGHLVDAFLGTLLTVLPHSHSYLLHAPQPDPAPVHIRRAEEYLKAYAHRPLSIAELSAAVGVSARALFAGFRAHHRCSPMAFLRDRRFDLARERLRTEPAQTVTSIATACGFQHLGRFSVGYGARFEESPSETRARGRGARPRPTKQQ